ncbi:MAG: nucleoside-diphosphate sugar epimerase/dehydratase [Desulfobulbus sp.]|jgi:hypothetical protein
MNERIVIFGTGGVGSDVKKLLESQGAQVLGFADNNSDKWGTVKDGLPVWPPHDLPELDIDVVAIGIFKAAPSVRRQLMEMGFAHDRIITPLEPDRVFVNTCYADDSGIAHPECEVDSPTTRAFLRHRHPLDDQSFLDKLEDLKSCCRGHNIPLAEICIVSGGVLQAYGLRRSKLFDDVDIIMTERFRRLYGRGLVIVSESAEMHPQNEFDIDDQTIIADPQWHFVWQGLKFMRLSLLYRQRKETEEGRLMAPLVNGTDDPV